MRIIETLLAAAGGFSVGAGAVLCLSPFHETAQGLYSLGIGALLVGMVIGYGR